MRPAGDPLPARAPATSDAPFLVGMAALGGVYVALIVLMLAADLSFTSPRHILEALTRAEIRAAIRLTLITCTLSATLALLVAVPLGFLLSRFGPRSRLLRVVDALVDIPIVLPPLVVGLSLLIMFSIALPGGRSLDRLLREGAGLEVTYARPAIVLAQFAVAAAFAVRTMRVAFDRIDPRVEQVAMTLGSSRRHAFFRVVLPQAAGGMLAAWTIAWARSLGEFGPILVFAGATRMRTEVLSTTVFLELSVGRLEAAVAVSLLMVVAAVVVLGLVRLLGANANA